MLSEISKFLMAFLYIAIGIYHFINPKLFFKIIPPWVGNKFLANGLAGFFEVLFGVGLLFPITRSYSAWGIILLLIAVFPANVYHYKLTKGTKAEWLTLLRLPIQPLLMYWAYTLT